MSATAEIPGELGLPVEIGHIDKELGKLWEASGDTKTRASLVNLAIYTENAEAVLANTSLISQIASEHACRALLIFANPQASQSGACAWINAHCHLAGKGERQICSEQITFQLDGDNVAALPNIVFSHLDSDLPLCFWWQGEFREPLDAKLWSWVDRLIYDSAEWANPSAQFALVQKIALLTDTRTVLCDLNWTRLLGARFALAQFFDHSFALQHLQNISRVAIVCDRRITGLLLLGWLAAQLNWQFQSLLGNESFLSSTGKTIEFVLEETQGPSISKCRFDCGDANLEISRDNDSDYYHARISRENVPCQPFLLSAGKSKTTDILLVELGRGGRHPLYNKALAVIQNLL